MKSPWRIGVAVSCVVLISGAAITWHFVEARVADRKLAADATARRARAEQGDAKAQSDLASMYYHGKGVPQDYAEAARWYRRAAEQGNVKAEYGLGYMYSQRQGLPRDYTEAANWYRKAAEQGDTKAQDGIAFLFYQGQGVTQDYTEAVRWYHKAADQGDAMAQDGLGFTYYQGKGVPQDYTEAARWYRKAAKQGDEQARRALGSMKIGYTTQSKINLSIVFLGSIVLLIRPRGSIRNRQQQRTALAGLLCLSWVGLQVYGHSPSVRNVRCQLVPIVWPKSAKTLLRICGILFIGFNIYAATHYQLRHLAPWLHAFYSANALVIGIAIPSAIFLWLGGEKTRGSQNGNNGAVPGTAVGSGTEPLRS
jgi:hypothetical protein